MIEVTNIPAELCQRAQWVCWRYEAPGGSQKPTKLPKIAGSTANAKSSDPATWRSFGECLRGVERGGGYYAGVGYVFSRDDPYVGIDLDEVRGPHTGELAPGAQAMLERLDSYAEVSPSGEGVKVWVRGELGRACKKPGLEIYPDRRYFTVTGQMLPETTPNIEERGGVLTALIDEEFPRSNSTGESPRYDGPPGAGLDLRQFLTAGGVRVLGEVPDGSAARVLRVVCPWSGEHTGGDKSGTRVGQYADGAAFFHCEHAHCSGRGWREFREMVEPPACPTKSKAKRVWR